MNPVIALVGNPNCGKTTLFNSLTGLRQKVGNYPGVTVERKEGTLPLPNGDSVTLVDLPGLYSLTPHSPDEQIARDALLGYLADTPRPEAILNVVDASNLERNLYLTSQLADLGLPIIVALTMGDTAARRGISVDATALAESLGIPVLPIHAASRAGIQELIRQLGSLRTANPPPRRQWQLPSAVEAEAKELAELLAQKHNLRAEVAFAEAVALLGMPEGPRHVVHRERWDKEIQSHLHDDQKRLSLVGVDTVTLIAEARYTDIGRVVAQAVHRLASTPTTLTERLDRVFLHRFWGYAIFLGLMLVLFQAMFSWAEIPKGWIEQGMHAISGGLTQLLPSGIVRDLLVDGALSGVGNTLVFLPQIVLLFLFISLLEDTGYLARAAFLMDRVMSRVGLHGKSFIPLLSSYACAIPGILATRTIESPKARLLTILVAPLMSCSARLPVYSVLIGAFIPAQSILGFHIGSLKITLLTYQALVLFSMYALGTIMVYLMAALFNRILLKGEAPSFLLEMPPYRKPQLRTVLYRMWETTLQFLQRAGTVILAISTVLWFLTTHPTQPMGTPAALRLERSYAGHLGRAIEPVIRPLGFDWKIGIGLVSSFAAREVFVSTMGIIYSVEAADDEQRSLAVRDQMRRELDAQGKPVYTPLVAICLMVFYVLALQCMSTVAVVKRETNGWKWPLFQIVYMTLLAWSVTFLVRIIGVALGYGG